MKWPEIKYCPGTLAENHDSYSSTAIKRVFSGKRVSHILPYEAPTFMSQFDLNRTFMSISGVQVKFSVLLDKNNLRLVTDGEQGLYILKPIPGGGKNSEQMPANEHVTMQIARQVFGIETAENALIFFKNGSPAYITKRFDVREDGPKWAQEDFASLAGRTPQTHGENYKYQGNFLELFELMKKYVPAYHVEALKLFKVVLFNYLFSNGDAHYKNFSLIETSFGDFRLSPAYDLLNSRIHIDDNDFALEEGLLPKNLAKGKIREQFNMLGILAKIPRSQIDKTFAHFTSKKEKVLNFIERSYLSEQMKRNYEQAFLARLNKLIRK